MKAAWPLWVLLAALLLMCAANITNNIKRHSPPVSVPYCLVQDMGIFWPCSEVWREYQI